MICFDNTFLRDRVSFWGSFVGDLSVFSVSFGSQTFSFPCVLFALELVTPRTWGLLCPSFLVSILVFLVFSGWEMDWSWFGAIFMIFLKIIFTFCFSFLRLDFCLCKNWELDVFTLVLKGKWMRRNGYERIHTPGIDCWILWGCKIIAQYWRSFLNNCSSSKFSCGMFLREFKYLFAI